MIGILYAFVPMICWGSVGFVSNKLGGTARQQTLGMTLGAFVFALAVFLIRQPQLTWATFAIGFVGGAIWSIGQSGQFHSFKYLGVSVAGPLSAGSQLVLGSIIGVLAFHEWTKGSQFLLGSLAIVGLIIGFYFSAKRDPVNTSLPAEFHLQRGLLSVAYSTLGYVGYIVLFNNLAALWFDLKIDTLTIILPMSIGMMAGAVILAGGKIPIEKAVFKNILVGLMWGLGNVFMLFAANVAGITIALTFSQLGVIISTIGGIVFLGEKKTAKEFVYIGIGIVLFVIGAILLAVVKLQ